MTIFRYLKKFFIVLLIFITAYFVTVRAIISWAQVSPNQFISVVEILSGAKINYQYLKIKQTWQGFVLETTNLHIKSDSINLDVKSIYLDLNIHAQFVYGMNYGKFLSINDLNLDIQVDVHKKIDIDKLIVGFQRFNADNLWERIELKNSQINLFGKNEIGIYIEKFNSFKTGQWQVSAEAKIFYQQSLAAYIDAKASFKTNPLGRIIQGKYSLNILSPDGITEVKSLLLSSLQEAFPLGDIALSLKGELFKNKPNNLGIELNIKDMVWKDKSLNLPVHFGADLNWIFDFKTLDYSLDNWLLDISNINFDDIYIDMPYPISIKMDSGNDISFEMFNFSLEPFKPLFLHALKHQKIELKSDKNIVLEITNLQGKIDLKEASLEHLDIHIKELELPAYKSIPAVILSDLALTKNNNIFKAVTEHPILISSRFLRPEPINISLENEVFITVESNKENKTIWSLAPQLFQVDNVPLKLVASGDFSGYINAQLLITDGESAQVKKLLPYPLMHEYLSSWLQTSLVSGDNITGKAVLKGNLQDFPFKNGEGVFTGNATVENTTIKFSPDWPVLTDFNAHLKFTPYDLQISTDSAKLMDISIGKTIVNINNLDTKNIAVEIQGTAFSANESAINLLLSSPLAKVIGIDDFLQNQVKASGVINVDLSKIWIPVYGFANRSVEVAGFVEIKDSDIKLFDKLEVKNVKGRVQFTEQFITAKKITGKFENGPITASITTNNKITNLNLQGRAVLDFPEHFSGDLPWSGKIQFPLVEKATITASFQASLNEITSKLPKPFDSYFINNTAKNIKAEIIVQDNYLSIFGELSDWGSLTGQWDISDKKLNVLNVNLGLDSAVKAKKGINIQGELEYLDVNEWLDFYSNLNKSLLKGNELGLGNLAWNQSQLKIKQLVVLDNKFNNTVVNWNYYKNKDLFKLNVNQEDLMFQVSKKTGEEFIVNLNRLKLLTKDTEEGLDNNICLKNTSKRIPNMSFSGQNIYINDRRIDSLSFKIKTTDSLIKAKNILAKISDIDGKITGEYSFNLKSYKSYLDFRIDSNNVQKLSRFLRVKKGFNGEEAYVGGNLHWEGFLDCFNVKNLSGKLSAAVKDGSIEDAEPGIARLIGLLSVESLARRIRLNIDDLTDKGLVFDEITSNAKLNSGIISLESFRLTAPSVDVKMFGQINLIAETIDASVNVTPAIGGTLPVIAALTGIVNPLVSLVAYLFMRVVPEINENLITFQYQVTGSLDSPQISRKNGVGNLINGSEIEQNKNDLLGLGWDE